MTDKCNLYNDNNIEHDVSKEYISEKKVEMTSVHIPRPDIHRGEFQEGNSIDNDYLYDGIKYNKMFDMPYGSKTTTYPARGIESASDPKNRKKIMIPKEDVMEKTTFGQNHTQTMGLYYGHHAHDQLDRRTSRSKRRDGSRVFDEMSVGDGCEFSYYDQRDSANDPCFSNHNRDGDVRIVSRNHCMVENERYKLPGSEGQLSELSNSSIGTIKPVGSKNIRGLRQFSMRVCRKVEEKGTTTYNEVADELILEMGMDVKKREQKNIRRRIYDALNVLMAMDVIKKDKKEIRWLGLGNTAARDLDLYRCERDRIYERVSKKKKILKDLIDRKTAVEVLVKRNEKKKKDLRWMHPR